MKKITTLFATLLALATTTMKAETADFEQALPDGWETVGTMKYYSERAKSGTYSIGNDVGSGWDTNRGNYIKTTKLEGDISLWIRSYKANTTGYIVLFKLSDDGETVGDKLVAFSSSSTTFAEKTYTLTEATRLAIVINYAHLDNMTYEEATAAEGPALAVKDGGTKLTSPHTHNFGLAAAGTQKEFTLSNPGSEDVTVSADATNGFVANLSATTIAAGSEVTLTVTMPDATATGVVTITPAAEGLEPFVINVSGTVKDPNKVFVDFADGQLPDGWTNVKIGSYGSGWEVNKGYASHSSSAYSDYLAALTSPKLTFAEGENLLFDVARYGSSEYSTAMVKVQTSADGENWTDVFTTPDAELVYGEWRTQSTEMPAGSYYIRFYGGYAHITNIYGGELPEEPNMKVTASDHNFGLITGDAEATFTISNTGRAKLEGIVVSSTSEDVTITGAPASLEAGESVTVTVTLSAATAGTKSATVSTSATGFEAVSFNVSAYVADAEAYTATFASLPEGWENTGWTFGSGYAAGAYTLSTSSRNSEMISPALTVADGQTLALEVQGTGSYPELKVYTSADNGTTWTLAKNFNSEVSASTSAFTVVVVEGIAAGSYKLKIEGYAVRLRTLNGYSLNQNAPELSVTPSEAFAAGKVTESASKTYTVSNVGTGELTVNIASDNADFTVEPAQLVVTDEPQTFTITFNYTAGKYGEKTATITVTPTYDEAASVSIAASAIAKDPDVWEEDFEDGIPATWSNNGWTISRKYNEASSVNHAYSGTSDANTLTTPRLQASKDEVLEFSVIDAEESYPLTVEYATERGGEYTLYATITESGTTQFVAPLEGTNYYYLRFSGRYIYLDDFIGFKLALPDHDMSIAESNVPANGGQYVEYSASVSVKELAGKDEEVTAKLVVDGKEVATATETVAASSTQSLTLTWTPDEVLTDVEAKIVVTYAGGTLETAVTTLTVAAAPTLDEEDGSLAAFENWGNYPVIKMKYTLKAGWNTIVLPFAWSDLSVFGEDAEAYELASYADGTLHFNKVTTLAAQTPYVIFAAKAQSELMFTNVTSFRTGTDADDLYARNIDGIRFQGTYAPIAAPGMEGKYGVTPVGKIARGTDKASIKGFRAYFELTDEQAAGIKALSFDGGNATGIFEIEGSKLKAEGSVFNVAGQRLQKAQKGINIINGKKILR